MFDEQMNEIFRALDKELEHLQNIHPKLKVVCLRCSFWLESWIKGNRQEEISLISGGTTSPTLFSPAVSALLSTSKPK